MNTYEEQECQESINTIDTLLRCGIFGPGNAGNPLQAAAFTQLMISLRDLLYKSEEYAKRISFADDIWTSTKVHDITDAVKSVRDACCHLNSPKLICDQKGNRVTFNVIYGKGTLMAFADLELKSDYDDDIAIFYGRNRLYLKRHIIRAFKEAVALLTPALAREADNSNRQEDD